MRQLVQPEKEEDCLDLLYWDKELNIGWPLFWGKEKTNKHWTVHVINIRTCLNKNKHRESFLISYWTCEGLISWVSTESPNVRWIRLEIDRIVKHPTIVAKSAMKMLTNMDLTFSDLVPLVRIGRSCSWNCNFWWFLVKLSKLSILSQ